MTEDLNGVARLTVTVQTQTIRKSSIKINSTKRDFAFPRHLRAAASELVSADVLWSKKHIQF